MIQQLSTKQYLKLIKKEIKIINKKNKNKTKMKTKGFGKESKGK